MERTEPTHSPGRYEHDRAMALMNSLLVAASIHVAHGYSEREVGCALLIAAAAWCGLHVSEDSAVDTLKQLFDATIDAAYSADEDRKQKSIAYIVKQAQPIVDAMFLAEAPPEGAA